MYMLHFRILKLGYWVNFKLRYRMSHCVCGQTFRYIPKNKKACHFVKNLGLLICKTKSGPCQTW